MRKIRTKLTSIDVSDIREAYEMGATQRELCIKYNMSIGQIGRIVRGESWTKVQMMPSADELEASANRLRALQRGIKVKGLAEQSPAHNFPPPMKKEPPSPELAERMRALGMLDPLEGGEAPDDGDGSGLAHLIEEGKKE